MCYKTNQREKINLHFEHKATKVVGFAAHCRATRFQILPLQERAGRRSPAGTVRYGSGPKRMICIHGSGAGNNGIYMARPSPWGINSIAINKLTLHSTTIHCRTHAQCCLLEQQPWRRTARKPEDELGLSHRSRMLRLLPLPLALKLVAAGSKGS